MDFIRGLPPSQGKNTILVVVDRLSQTTHLLALSHPYTARTVANEFFKGVVKLHVMPLSIISDRYSIFISHFWNEFFKMSGIQLKMSSLYHSQIDDQTEVVNRCVEQYLQCLVHQQPRKQSSLLPQVEFWYNTTFPSSIGITSFHPLYGQPPPAILHYHNGMTIVNEVDQQLSDRNELLTQLKANLHAATNRMQHLANAKRCNLEFQVGDQVILKLQPYRQHTAFGRAVHKLSCCFFGPYQIEQKLGPVTYKLKLLEGTRIYPIFQVSLLKKKLRNFVMSIQKLPPTTEKGDIILQLETILKTCWIKRDSKFVEESLIKWQHLPPEDTTWDARTLGHYST